MLAMCCGLGLYYLWTLKLGARAAVGPKTDVRNVLFVAYELLGFSGLGPGRIALRASGLELFFPHLPLLVMHAALVATVFTLGAVQLAGFVARRTPQYWVMTVGLATGFVFAVGVVSDFRVLGRHFAPLLPLVCLLFGMGLWRLTTGGGWRRWMAGLFVASSLTSAIELRFAERHAKDAYREAAALARAALARGETVWWSAGVRGAQVYGVPLNEKDAERGKAWLIKNPVSGFEVELVPPDWVFASKPDLYDVSGALGQYLQRAGLQREQVLPAFTVWHRRKRRVEGVYTRRLPLMNSPRSSRIAW
jgi:hypothetical protein